MKEYNKQNMKELGTIVLLFLAAIFAIAASFGSIKFGVADKNAIYWVAGIANLCGWGFIAYRLYKHKSKSE